MILYLHDDVVGFNNHRHRREDKQWKFYILWIEPLVLSQVTIRQSSLVIQFNLILMRVSSCSLGMCWGGGWLGGLLSLVPSFFTILNHSVPFFIPTIYTICPAFWFEGRDPGIFGVFPGAHFCPCLPLGSHSWVAQFLRCSHLGDGAEERVCTNRVCVTKLPALPRWNLCGLVPGG